jgi:CRISPR-associated protein Cas2
MEQYGERLQYSVFICDLNRTELTHARHQVEQHMNLGHDSVVIVDLGDLTNARFTFIGQRRELPTNDTKIL